LSRLSGTLIDGAIMVTPTVVNVASDVPIVAVDPHTGRADLPTVEADSRGGAYEVTSYLISLGHRRIGFVAGRPDLKSSRLRDAGYQEALASAGIAYDPGLMRVGFHESDTARRAAQELLMQRDRPTAVFAANDLSAMAIIEVAQGLGLDVPADLSVAGFDDVPEASRLALPLTTVRQPMQSIGQTAARMLTTLMDGEALQSTHVLLPTKLVPRATTAPRCVRRD
jgi:LacI family transcriptional regulator